MPFRAPTARLVARPLGDAVSLGERIPASGCGGRKRGEQIDDVVIRIDHLRVALAPERVPRLLLGAEAGGCDTLVHAIDLGGARAFEGETHAMAGGLAPPRIELLDQLDAVPHQSNAAREPRVEMVAVWIADGHAEKTVEADRLCHVLGHDADRRERGHGGMLLPRGRGASPGLESAWARWCFRRGTARGNRW